MDTSMLAFPKPKDKKKLRKDKKNNKSCSKKKEFCIMPKSSLYETERKIYYVADFCYIQKGKIIVEDVKGKKTDVYKLKRKLFLYKYSNIEFREV